LSQISRNGKELSPLKPKEYKVKFRHYTSKQKWIRVLSSIIAVIIIIPSIIMIILNIMEGQYPNIVIYVILIVAVLIISEIIENIIKKKVLNRLIEGVVIKRAQTVSPVEYPAQKNGSQATKGQEIVVFVSYATKDAEVFKIREISESLSNREKIEDVLYWQEDMKDNIIKYMSDNLDRCDIMLLFCSPNALASEPVEKEWTAADIIGKPIIPIFNDPIHIPALLRTRLGIKFDPFDVQKNTNEAYNLILKKLS
jgi:hypothetical protein